MFNSLINVFKPQIVTSYFLLILLALASPTLNAQSVFTIEAVINTNGQPNLNSTLIVLENDTTEVVSQNQPALILSIKAFKAGEKKIKFKPNLQVLTKSGAKSVAFDAISLRVGESKQGLIQIEELGELNWSFNLQSQNQLKKEIPPCLYSECQ